jgi:hypothetical protein
LKNDFEVRFSLLRYSSSLLPEARLELPLTHPNPRDPHKIPQGHDNTWARNIIAFADGYILHNGYGGQVGAPGRGILDGHEQHFIDNVALSTRSNENYALPICSGRGTTVMSGTRYFVRGGNATTPCGAGFDKGAVVADFTATMADDTIALARKVLWV